MFAERLIAEKRIFALREPSSRFSTAWPNPQAGRLRAPLFLSPFGDMTPTVSRSNLDAFISLLRKKVDLPSEKRLVHTLKGVGYILRVDEPSLHDSKSETMS